MRHSPYTSLSFIYRTDQPDQSELLRNYRSGSRSVLFSGDPHGRPALTAPVTLCVRVSVLVPVRHERRVFVLVTWEWAPPAPIFSLAPECKGQFCRRDAEPLGSAISRLSTAWGGRVHCSVHLPPSRDVYFAGLEWWVARLGLSHEVLPQAGRGIRQSRLLSLKPRSAPEMHQPRTVEGAR